ncbi:MAG: propionyl-CoA synthetase, partial [Pseudomonadota bacterium]|nr:propionyl-CoA synthetase [Pseudomonadota bacterium]
QASHHNGQQPLVIILLNDGVTNFEATLESEVIQRVRDNIGAVASFRHAVVVQRLPKTRSGKILRKVLRNIANSEEYQTPSTIDDPACLVEIEEVLSKKGLRK